MYKSPVPVFETGQAEYEHCIRDIDNPSPEALAAVSKIERVRDDPAYFDGPTTER